MTTQNQNDYVIPEIVFPQFPSLDGAYSISATETAVPNSWIFKLAEYRIKIEETEEIYKSLHDMQKGGKE